MIKTLNFTNSMHSRTQLGINCFSYRSQTFTDKAKLIGPLSIQVNELHRYCYHTLKMLGIVVTVLKYR